MSLKSIFSNPKTKTIIVVVTTAFITIFALVIYYWFLTTPKYKTFETYMNDRFWIYFFIMIVTRTISVIYPPIPGYFITWGAIPIFGWEWAYTADLIANLIGGSVAFKLGKVYGKKIIKSILGNNALEKITKVKVKKNREAEGIFMLRCAMSGTLPEISYYVAGVLNVSFKNFLISLVLSHFVCVMTIYYIFKDFGNGRNLFFAIPIFLTILIIGIKARKRYFE